MSLHTGVDNTLCAQSLTQGSNRETYAIPCGGTACFRVHWHALHLVIYKQYHLET